MTPDVGRARPVAWIALALPMMATWRSGYAAACKAVYTGSTPVVAFSRKPSTKVSPASPSGSSLFAQRVPVVSTRPRPWPVRPFISSTLRSYPTPTASTAGDRCSPYDAPFAGSDEPSTAVPYEGESGEPEVHHEHLGALGHPLRDECRLHAGDLDGDDPARGKVTFGFQVAGSAKPFCTGCC